MKTFIALCIGYGKNVFFIHKKKCYELVCNEDEPFYCVHWKDTPDRYYYEGIISDELKNTYKNNGENFRSTPFLFNFNLKLDIFKRSTCWCDYEFYINEFQCSCWFDINFTSHLISI